MDNFDVDDLSDKELKQMLLRNGYVAKYGKEPGPIVKSTRSVYEKQLVKLLQEKPQQQPTSAAGQTRTPTGQRVDENDAAASYSPTKLPTPKTPPSSTLFSNVSQPKQQPSSYVSTNFSSSNKPQPSLFSLPSDRSTTTTTTTYREVVVDNDRMEGEEEFRYVPQQQSYKSPTPSAPLFNDERTDVRRRFPETTNVTGGGGSGSAQLFQKPVHLPGHSLRPWVSQQREETFAPTNFPTSRTPPVSTTSSLFDRTPFFGDKKSAADLTSKSSTSTELQSWSWRKSVVLIGFIIGVIFIIMLVRRFVSHFLGTDDEPKSVE